MNPSTAPSDSALLIIRRQTLWRAADCPVDVVGERERGFLGDFRATRTAVLSTSTLTVCPYGGSGGTCTTCLAMQWTGSESNSPRKDVNRHDCHG